MGRVSDEPMRISIDYDGTYTRDPDFWNQVIRMAQQRGHEVKCVTMRFPNEAVDMPCDVIYTSRQSKRNFFPADVWIDDQPFFIDMDAAL
jgi:hypothetical protein